MSGPAPVPADVQDVLRSVAAGRLPPDAGLVQLIVLSPDEPTFRLAIGTAERWGDQRLAALCVLAAENPKAFPLLRGVLTSVDHTPATDPGAGLASFAAMFDRAAAVSPEASVAIRSLGDPDRLAAITREIVAVLASRGVLGKDRVVVEVGCGFGRFAAPLLGEGCRYHGFDISAGMIASAHERHPALAGTTFTVAPAHALPMGDGSADLVLAVDAFPYVVAAGGDLAKRSVAEFVRVLGPGGDLAILNHSYRDDIGADIADLESAALRHGLETVELGARPFASWDGALFHLRRPTA